MKWFKHDSQAIKDEKLQMLMSKHGPVAYTIFFVVCELCAEKIDKNMTPKIKIGWPYVEQLMHCKRATVRRVLNSCRSAGLLLFNSDDKQMICSVPNLLKRLDNYTKDLEVSTKRLPSKEVRSKKKEKELEENRPMPSALKPQTLKKCHDETCGLMIPESEFMRHMTEHIKKLKTSVAV
jgi:hypothetical protein